MDAKQNLKIASWRPRSMAETCQCPCQCPYGHYL